MRQHWEPDELIEHWGLDEADLALVRNKTGATRLGFTVMLKFFEAEGRFFASHGEVPADVVRFLATQAGVAPEAFGQYPLTGRSAEAHRAQIRRRFGAREATEADGERLASWLATEVVPTGERREHLADQVTARCRELRVEPPSPGQVDRLVRSAVRRFEERFCATTSRRLGSSTVAALEELVAEDQEGGGLAALRADPRRPSLDTFLEEVAKLERLRQLELPEHLFDDVSARVVQTWRDRAARETPSALRAHPSAVRATLLAALCWSRSREVTDALVDVLIGVVHKIGAHAERRVERELVADLRQVAGKTNLLFRLAEAVVDHPDGIVSEVLYPVVGEQTLKDLVREYKSTGPAYRQHVQHYLRASYGGHYRRMLPELLATLVFRSNNVAHRPVLEALDLVARYLGRSVHHFDTDESVPLEGVVLSSWREFVVSADARGRQRVNRVAYEVCVLQALRDKLRCREIWVDGADRWRNPDDDLPQDFDANRAQHYHRLGQPLDPAEFVEALRRQLTESLDDLDAALAGHDGPVRVTGRRGGWVTVSPLEAQPEPPNLGRLNAAVGSRWPATSLLDMLKEADLRLGFTRHFETTATREVLDSVTLQRRLLLCLYAYGTNAGIRRVAAGDHGESENDLRYVRRRYLTAGNLRRAITAVVNATLAARQESLWGQATTTASDSTKFGSWDQNLLTEWHARYRGPGIMIYWHVERRALCIYSQLKSCSSSEVAAMIEGLLRHCSEMEVECNYVDSHGQSEIGFAFCQLLGFRLLPRLKRIGAQRLYRPEAGPLDSWPNLVPVLSRPVNWDLIAQQYDQMVRYATAMKLGTADSEAILRRFTRANVAHPTYRALGELGKVVKTVFLCEYLRLEQLRREVHEGLNVVENWNGANAFIYFGKGGEVTSNRPEDQELAVLSLHLLQACLVYINTLMIQQVLDDPTSGIALAPDDLRGLTPLIYSHVNPYGTFRLDMTKRLPLAA